MQKCLGILAVQHQTANPFSVGCEIVLKVVGFNDRKVQHIIKISGEIAQAVGIRKISGNTGGAQAGDTIAIFLLRETRKAINICDLSQRSHNRLCYLPGGSCYQNLTARELYWIQCHGSSPHSKRRSILLPLAPAQENRCSRV